MSERPPPRLLGNDRLAVWLNQLRDFAVSSRVVSVYNALIDPGTDGITLKAKPGSGGTSSPGPVRASLFEVHGDHLVCKLYGTQTQVKVAKVPWMRLSIGSEVIDGVTVNYTSTAYTAPAKYQRRDATPNPGTAEKQVTYPYYAIGQEIWITPITPFDTSDSPSVSATYIETHSRVWLRKVDQTT